MFLLLAILLPLLGFAACMTIFRRAAQTAYLAALATSGVAFLATLAMVPEVAQDPTKLAQALDLNWIPYPPIHFSIGVDGLSIWLVAATALLSLLAIVTSSRRDANFLGWLLLLEAAIIGVFVAQDLFLFYVCFELTLVPVLFLMGQYGKSTAATVKFFIYTFAGSILMLAAIVYLFLKSGSFDFQNISLQIAAGSFRLSPAEQLPLFLAFFLAFAVKTPLFPFHSWQADAYASAPSPLGVVMAGLMGKLGTYGLLRFCLPLFPNAARDCAHWINALAIIAILYGALVAIVQTDIKRMLAFSSLSHLGFIILGIFSFHINGLDGAAYQMVCHAVTTGGLFLLAGYLEERKGNTLIASFGGLATRTPWLATTFLIAALASAGLPSLNNFVGEYLILQGAAFTGFPYAAAAAVGVILSAVYLLWAYQRTFLGPKPDSDTPDLSNTEAIAITPLLLLMIAMGVWSTSFLPLQSAVNAKILQQSKMNVEFRVQTTPANTNAEVAHGN
ncbi:complex I subunit 4 family protein [Bryobacter aggregatus]|uniref:complex I subunit 4 family protein n=1 Tax=Bryobacter aggregatus TaxID=360054 RepID=UPI0004E28782|nr:NADH-quinone oxidoreductase subunit M [Bryobacter aggregatus]